MKTMARYKVTILERTYSYSSQVFTAKSEREARQKAKESDYRTTAWERGYSDGDVEIEEVEKL